MANRGLEELGQIVREETASHLNSLLLTNPDLVKKWLREAGLKPLAQFEVKEGVIRHALGNDRELVIGSDLHQDFDVEGLWKAVLRKLVSDQSKHAAWDTSERVEALVVNIQDAAKPGEAGSLLALLRLYRTSEDLGLFSLPVVRALVTFKWKTWAAQALTVLLVFYLLWLIGFVGFAWLFQNEDLSLDVPGLLRTPYGQATLALEAASLLGMAPFLLLYIMQCLGGGGLTSLLAPARLVDIVAFTLTLLVAVNHLSRSALHQDWLSACIAVQCLVLWSKITYFIRGFSSEGSFVLHAIQRVLWEVRGLLLLLLLTLLAFATAFHTLYRLHPAAIADFATLPSTLLAVFAYSTSPFSFAEFVAGPLPVAATLLAVLLTVGVHLLLLKMLIALFVASYTKVSRAEEVREVMATAELIVELEATLPHWLAGGGAAAPRFVHVLRLAKAPAADVTVEVNRRLDRLEHAQHVLQDTLAVQFSELSRHVNSGLKGVEESIAHKLTRGVEALGGAEPFQQVTLQKLNAVEYKLGTLGALAAQAEVAKAPNVSAELIDALAAKLTSLDYKISTLGALDAQAALQRGSDADKLDSVQAELQSKLGTIDYKLGTLGAMAAQAGLAQDGAQAEESSSSAALAARLKAIEYTLGTLGTMVTMAIASAERQAAAE